MNLKVMTAFILQVFLLFGPKSKAWSGNVCRVWAVRYDWKPYCASAYIWGCTLWKHRWERVDYLQQVCCSGWTHDGNEMCTKPVCYPACKNGGSCRSPNLCQCTSNYTGPTCETHNETSLV